MNNKHHGCLYINIYACVYTIYVCAYVWLEDFHLKEYGIEIIKQSILLLVFHCIEIIIG